MKQLRREDNGDPKINSQDMSWYNSFGLPEIDAMKLKKIENYDAGYSKESLLRKCAAGALGVAMLSGLAGCAPAIEGSSEPNGVEGSSALVTESDRVEDDNLSYDGKVAITSSDDDEQFMTDGDIMILPQDVDSQ